MTTGPPPNYYAILEVREGASTQQIRDAYKRAALKTHPDRVPAESPERASRTRKFQLVNDAYFTLSDPTRRREYDSQRRLFGGGGGGGRGYGGGGFEDDTTAAGDDPFAEADNSQSEPNQSAYSWAWNFFTGNNGQQKQQQQGQTRQETENDQFGDVFEEMLREEGMADANGAANGGFWGLLGGASGASLGFIIANVPGLLAGAVAGNRLGAIRDVKGKSVYSVFQELPQGDKARLLSQLAAKVFSHAVGS